MHIQILAYDDCLASELFAFHDVITMGGRLAGARGEPAIKVSIATLSGREVTLAGGARIKGRRPETANDLLVVPGFDLLDLDGMEARLAALRPEIEYLRARAATGGPVASICVGAFVLGQAGLLDDRAVTTAWLFTDELARRHPRARVNRDALIVEDGLLTTAGAFTASHDLALHLIDRHCGQGAARATRNVALIDSGRTSQRPFVDPGLLPSRAATFSSRVETWLMEHLRDPYSLKSLADGLATSSRTLLRRYKAERGRTPLAYVHSARVERAKLLLEQTALSVAEIAHHVGYEDVSAFRILFGRHAGASPGSYRQRFQRAPE